jgi:hypothetical protein
MFTKIYLAAGLAALGLFALGEWRGTFSPAFGAKGASVSTASRQGYWYTYRRQTYTSGSGRSPGGGSYGGGGYSGGK